MKMLRNRLRHFAAGRPAAMAAVCWAIAAVAVAAVLLAGYGTSSSAIFAAILAGVAVAVLAGATFGVLLREQTALLARARQRIAELAAVCGQGEQPPAGLAGVADLRDLEREVTAISRAYRSLQREREQSQSALDQQIARQAEFYARLSHELRSPLNAILGYASLAIEDAEAGDVADLKDLRNIRRAGQNLLALIDSLLQLAEDRSGRESIARAPFVLGEVLAQVVGECAETAPAASIVLAEGCGRETLFGNRAKTARALASVLDDALRSRHARRVAVSTRPPAGPGTWVEIVVEVETGGAASNSHGEALTRHLADRLAAAVGGSLAVEPDGASAWVYVLRLPLDTDNGIGAPAPRPVPLAGVPAVDAPALAKSALVIDDDPATIDLMSRWLQRGGYGVRSAFNAEQGLALAEVMQPDIVILDALMPGRTGYDILPDLTALPALHDTPILLVTVDDDRTRGLAAGASDYVRKPITEIRLREIISVYERDLQGEVLIVDDDPDAAALHERIVRRLGFSARIAADGAQGLAAVAERAPAAILLDLKMPNLDGFEFIEAMTGQKDHAAIPLLVLSGLELSVAQHHRLLAAGCRYHMKGNTAPREIAESLREMVA
jgi:hypothetical protein